MGSHVPKERGPCRLGSTTQVPKYTLDSYEENLQETEMDEDLSSEINRMGGGKQMYRPVLDRMASMQWYSTLWRMDKERNVQLPEVRRHVNILQVQVVS